MKNLINSLPSGHSYIIDEDVVKSVKYNGTYCPSIKRIIFNLKTEDDVAVLGEDGKPTGKRKQIPLEKPVLATTVYFGDGTRVTVKTSAEDPVTLGQSALSDGSNVPTASRHDKESAIAHAVLKRLNGVEVVDKKTGCSTGKIDGNGYGRFLTELVDAAEDQAVKAAEAEIERAARKKAYEDRQSAKPAKKEKKYSFADIAQLLGPVLENAVKDPGLVDRIVKAFKG